VDYEGVDLAIGTQIAPCSSVACSSVAASSAQPLIEVGGDELVVAHVRIRATDAIDGFGLM
jgi:hypothetical protein